MAFGLGQIRIEDLSRNREAYLMNGPITMPAGA